MTAPRFAFFARNPFQARSMAPLCRAVDGVMLCRAQLAKDIGDLSVTVKPWRWPWSWLDGRYDVLVMHGAYPGAMTHRKSKIAMIQYGYAKEPYNFGSWRAAADLILAYGPYAAAKFATFAPVCEIGHPSAQLVSEFWQAPAKFTKDQRLRVLYAPTWGALSSLEQVTQDVLTLANDHDVTIKLHHNTIAREPARMARFAEHAKLMAEPDQALMSAILEHDIVISDNSGAIFDAIFCQRPVVLVDGDPALVAKAQKSDPYSLEIAQRSAIGVQAKQGQLQDAVEAAAHPDYAPDIDKSTLYSDINDPMAAMVAALNDLANGTIKPEQMQGYVQSAIRKAARKKQALTRLCIGLLFALICLALLA